LVIIRSGPRRDPLVAAKTTAPSSQTTAKPKFVTGKLKLSPANQWYFGMKAQIGADRDSKLVHTVVVTAANVADINKTAELLHEQVQQVHADAGYTGVENEQRSWPWNGR